MPTIQPLQQAIEMMAPRGIFVGYKAIGPNDELALMPEEQPAFAASVAKVRRASGAARIVARQLMQKAGVAPLPIPKSTGGMPGWPPGLVGSLAHDPDVAVAAIAAARDFQGVGVDVEPPEPLGDDLLGIVASNKESEQVAGDPLGGRLLFSVKEAVYKAVYPLDRQFLDHHDVEVDLLTETASIRGQRTVPFRFCTAPRIVTLVFIQR
jgi:4'-phosphopantetheinyl transferase EntD